MELPCDACGGYCCTGHRGVLMDDGSTLLFVDGQCPHFEGGRCGIYETRPQGCRDFDCSREPKYVNANPHVAAVLTVHGVVVRDPGEGESNLFG